MGVLGDRISAFTEDRITAWKERLRGWAVSVVELGLEALLKAIEKAAAPHLKPLIERMEATGEIPDELKPMFKELKEPTGAWPALLAMGAGMGVMGGAIGILGDVMFGSMARSMMKRVTSRILEAIPLIVVYRRLAVDDAFFYDHMAELGFDKVWADLWLKATEEYPPVPDMVRFADFGSFDPEIIEKWREFYDAPSWIREPMALIGILGDWANKYWFSHWIQPGRYELGEMHRRGLVDDEGVKLAYRTMGYSPFWQDKLLDLVKAVPTRVDVRRFWDMRTIDEARLREIYHAQGYYDKDLEDYVLWTKVYVAFPDLIARWRNGWITLADVKSELTGLGMPADRVEEFIETKMKATEAERTTKEKDLTKTDITKGVKTEVITRGEGVELLMDLGYEEDEAVYILAINIPEDEQVSVVKTRELTKADILKGLKTEVITEPEAVTKLQELRYTLDDAEFLLKIFKAAIKPPVEPRAREASKADIVLAVKKGLITPEDGYLMLQDIGFTPEASHFILTVRVEESPFSPVSYEEFKDLTGKWRLAAGREVKAMPEELKKAGAEVVRLTNEVGSLERALAEEAAKLVEEEVLPPEATKKRDELRVALRRAESALALAKSGYASRLAAWRHGG